MKISFSIEEFDNTNLDHLLVFVKEVKPEFIEVEHVMTSIQLHPDDIARFRDSLHEIGYYFSRKHGSSVLKLGKRF